MAQSVEGVEGVHSSHLTQLCNLGAEPRPSTLLQRSPLCASANPGVNTQNPPGGKPVNLKERASPACLAVQLGPSAQPSRTIFRQAVAGAPRKGAG